MREPPELLTLVTMEELVEWHQHPTSKKVLNFLGQIQSNYQSQLSQGATLNLSSPEATAMQTTLLLGKIFGISLILSLKEEAQSLIDQTQGEQTWQ